MADPVLFVSRVNGFPFPPLLAVEICVKVCYMVFGLRLSSSQIFMSKARTIYVSYQNVESYRIDIKVFQSQNITIHKHQLLQSTFSTIDGHVSQPPLQNYVKNHRKIGIKLAVSKLRS